MYVCSPCWEFLTRGYCVMILQWPLPCISPQLGTRNVRISRFGQQTLHGRLNTVMFMWSHSVAHQWWVIIQHTDRSHLLLDTRHNTVEFQSQPHPHNRTCDSHARGVSICIVSAVFVVAVWMAKRAVSASVLLSEFEDTCIEQISKPVEKCNSRGDGRGTE